MGTSDEIWDFDYSKLSVFDEKRREVLGITWEEELTAAEGDED